MHGGERVNWSEKEETTVVFLGLGALLWKVEPERKKEMLQSCQCYVCLIRYHVEDNGHHTLGAGGRGNGEGEGCVCEGGGLCVLGVCASARRVGAAVYAEVDAHC